MEAGEREANTRLIAAAPDLLAALEFAIAARDGKVVDYSAQIGGWEQARAALAKARAQE